METFALEKYLSNGVTKIVKGIMKASLQNPKASLFMVKHHAGSKKASQLREEAENAGEHIPPFLIASITHQCNLHCKGCYARANHSCKDQEGTEGIMTADEWGNVFTQAAKMGVAFILLAGGEPFVRKDVLKRAGEQDEILFPIFTNGTMIDAEYLQLLDANRNLMPVISIEGNEQTTDARRGAGRGAGIYQKLKTTMTSLYNKGILYGASVTVTKENIEEVLSDEFIRQMEHQGVKAVVYVEYVPVEGNTQKLAPDDADREKMMHRLAELRNGNTELLLIAFPGDEKSSGGCLAAGRGFFHINAYGGAEPCPFSPYSDVNVKKVSLREALKSPLFQKLASNGNLTQEHVGGCVLFEQKEQVEI